MERQARAGAHVAVTALTKRYAAAGTSLTALDDVTLSVAAGGLVAVMGPSGSGKSTLLHLVGGMDATTSGSVRVADYRVTELRGGELALYRRRVGFVFQRFHLLPALTARDNIVASVLPFRTSFDKHERAAMLLDAVGLAGREAAFPSELSGGEQQRVAIARALMSEPLLLLADEPTGNLDSRTGGEIIDLLLRLRAEHHMTVILATHDALIASRCDRIIRLLDGRVLDDVVVRPGPTAETLARISRPG